VAFQIDNLLNANGIIQNASIVFYISNEAISILENGVKMGLPIPEKLRNAIAALKEEDE
jgi:toxin secretion/phage lysis holin